MIHGGAKRWTYWWPTVNPSDLFKVAKKQERFVFGFEPGRQFLGKYVVISLLGAGWEGEVYHVREIATGIERAAKFFYPHRNPRDRAINFYAKKLNKLRHCPILIQYHTHEVVRYRRQDIKFLVSEYVEGILLREFVRRQPDKRLSAFEGLHLLYALTEGLEYVHDIPDYHGDLHWGNIIVRRQGIGFDVKLVDFFHWGPPKAENIREDVIDVIRIFYDALGGRKQYRHHPTEIKAICCGLKRSLISKKFKTAGHLRQYLETMEWNN